MFNSTTNINEGVILMKLYVKKIDWHWNQYKLNNEFLLEINLLGGTQDNRKAQVTITNTQGEETHYTISLKKAAYYKQPDEFKLLKNINDILCSVAEEKEILDTSEFKKQQAEQSNAKKVEEKTTIEDLVGDIFD